MQRISIKRAEPGMVLAKDVMAPDGRILCGKSTKLTPEILERLNKIGVTSIYVKANKKQSAQILKANLAQLKTRFEKVKDDPVLVALMNTIGEYWIEIQKG